MGVSVYAHAAIGLRVDWSQIRTGKKKVKAFKHNHPKDWEIDPKTGEKLWREVDTYIDTYNPDINTLNGYGVLFDYQGDPSDVIICLVHACSGDVMEGSEPDFTKIEKLSEKLTAFQKEMESLGLWNWADFGLWAVGVAQ